MFNSETGSELCSSVTRKFVLLLWYERSVARLKNLYSFGMCFLFLCLCKRNVLCVIIVLTPRAWTLHGFYTCIVDWLCYLITNHWLISMMCWLKSKPLAHWNKWPVLPLRLSELCAFIKYERVHIIITLLSVCTFQMFLSRTSISLSSQTCSVKENTYISCWTVDEQRFCEVQEQA